MEKLNEIKNVLNFYTLSNKLKNEIIDEKNNYSIADHLFGSMILATAIDSEFKEADDLPKIYRMLFLNEFNILYPNNNFIKKLKLGKQYSNETIEARNMNSENGKLVFKYKMLDILLTNLIKEKENEDYMDLSELIKEGSTIISSMCSKKPSECEEIFKFYYLNFRLKNKVRTGWDCNHWNINSDRIETVSEHVIGTISLALALNSEFGYNIDTGKQLKTLVMHETGETLIGDITPFDGITPEQKEELEHKAMRDALGNLKDKDKLLNLLLEFDDKSTPEALCSYLCDKIEADLQSKVYKDKEMHHSLDDQKNNVVFKSSKVQQMLKDGAQDAFDIWYEWDKSIFEGNEQFPEFMNILDIARANNLFYLTRVVKERVNLTKEDHSFLTDEISDFVKELYKNKEVVSVYLTNYQDLENKKGTINIVAILDSISDNVNTYELIDKINSKIAKINKTGVNVDFDCDYENKYSITALNPSEVHRIETLAESKILFDKTGNLTRVQDSVKEYGHLYDFYLVDYVPPVDDAILDEINNNKQR